MARAAAEVPVGTHRIEVRVADGRGGAALLGLSIKVENANDPPAIRSTPRSQCQEDQPCIYQVVAEDPDRPKEKLLFKLVKAPAGMTIGSSDGVIKWTPSNAEVGIHPVEVTVEDPSGAKDSQSFNLTVRNVNDPPSIVSTPRTRAREDEPYDYLVVARDEDPTADRLSYSLVSSPPTMTIDGGSGLIRWTPSNGDVGKHAIEIRVVDGRGGASSQAFSLQVEDVNDAPRFVSRPVTEAVMEVSYAYLALARDDDPGGDSLTFSLVRAPAGMTVDPTGGLVRWRPSHLQVGEHQVELRVQDGRGGEARQAHLVSVQADRTAPTAVAGPWLFVDPGQVELDGNSSRDPAQGDRKVRPRCLPALLLP